mmetsp:Transcript_19498/g.24077  ORF Transcript_19498/g.24077 Transcript_19498/m.24077 type:complete len:161 (+) Transcript_19498:74-556(+)
MAKASEQEIKKLQTEQKSSDNNGNNNNNNNNDGNKKVKSSLIDNPAMIGNLKQLRIQSGALKRLTKELESYIKELNDLKAELQDMLMDEQKNDKKSEIKRQRQAIEETDNVINGIRPRLVKTYETVVDLIADCDGCQNDEPKLFENTKIYMDNAKKYVTD